MKSILLAAAMTMMSASAFALQCEVDMVDSRTNRLITTIRAYDYGDGCKEGMKECRKEIRILGLLGRADCVRATVKNPYPNPRPNPWPNPETNPRPNPYPQYGVTVSALVEDRPFQITARDASELYVNCLTEIRRVTTTSSDELFFTVNGNRYQSTGTSGWYNDTMICSIFEQEARRSISVATIYPARIVGSLENFPFRFEGYDRATLLNSCILNISSMRLGSTDEMSYSLNGLPFQRLTTSVWWQNPAIVCKAMLINMDSRL